MILYKLTRQDMTTHNNFKWELKKTSVLLPPGRQLCSSSFYHAYLSPELAVLLNPIHANYQNPRLFEAEGDVAATDHDLKVGVKQLTLLSEMPLPVSTVTQQVAFSILVAKRVYHTPGFHKWADDWLDNKDRPGTAAYAAAAYAAYSARAADAADAADAAAYAAYAARAACAAAYAARAACAAAYAADAAYVASAAAYAASAAARAAARAGIELDLIALSKECLKY